MNSSSIFWVLKNPSAVMPHGGAAYLGLFRREKFGERTNVLHLISLVREMGVTLTTTPRLASHADVLRLAMERVRSLGTSALDATPRPVPRVVLSSPSDFSRRSNPSGAPLPIDLRWTYGRRVLASGEDKRKRVKPPYCFFFSITPFKIDRDKNYNRLID